MPDTPQPSPSMENAAVTNVVIQRHLTIKPFVKQADNNDTILRLERYKQDIDRKFGFFGITDPMRKKDGLLIYGGEDIVDVDKALHDTTSKDGNNNYKVLIRKINTHFMPKQKDFTRFQLSEPK